MVKRKKIELFDLFGINMNNDGNIHMLSFKGNKLIEKNVLVYFVDKKGEIISSHDYDNNKGFKFLFELVTNITDNLLNEIVLVQIQNYEINGDKKNTGTVIPMKLDNLGTFNKLNTQTLLNIFNIDIEWYWHLESLTKQNNFAKELYEIITFKLEIIKQKINNIYKLINTNNNYFQKQNIVFKKDTNCTILNIKNDNYSINCIVVDGKIIITDFQGLLSGIESLIENNLNYMKAQYN
ncbi:MAG: hypothetical protein V3575_00005 [Candidatus Absconditabacteria bacterium]